MNAHVDGPRERVKWANQHLNRLDRETRKFLRNKPFAVSETFDPARNRHEWRLRVHREPKLGRWGLLTGDCVHNLRSALDNLAWRLAGSDPSDRTTQFPITRAPSEFPAQRIARLPSEPAELVRAVQPNTRDDDGGKALALLAELDNLDKHRTIPVIAALASESSISFDFPGHRGPVPDPGSIEYHFDAAIRDGALVAAADWRSGLKVEAKGRFDFTLTLGDGTTGAGYGLIWVLREMEAEVNRILDLFVDPKLGA